MIIEINGVRGGYEVAGDGPPLVILASPLARMKTYRPTAASLGRHFRVFTVELPGSGRSERLRAGWSAQQYAEWAAGFIEATGLVRPVVVGHSNSGPIAVALAARHPDRVGRVVVVDATGAGGPHSIPRVLAGGLIDVALEFGLVLRAWHHVVGNLFLHPRNFVRQLRECLTDDMTGTAAAVTAPTLVAWGRRDHTLPPRCAEEYARHLPDARVYLSPEGSHDWLISRPDEFSRVVREFAGCASSTSSRKRTS